MRETDGKDPKKAITVEAELVRSFLGAANDTVSEVAARVAPKVYKTLADHETDQVTEVEATSAARAVLEAVRAVAGGAGLG